MDNENKQDAAEPTPASDGSVAADPVAWLVTGDGYEYATLLKEHAEVIAEEEDGAVVPLYRSPTLTDAEREAIRTVLRRLREDYFAGRFYDSVSIAAVIDGLLERLGGGR